MAFLRSGALIGFEALSYRLGANPALLLDEAGLNTALLRDPNTYLPYAKVATLLEIAATTFEEPFFGLLLSQNQGGDIMGDLSLAMVQHDTVRASLEGMNQLLYLHAQGARLAFHHGDRGNIEFILDFDSPNGNRQLIQLSLGQIYNQIAGSFPSYQNEVFIQLCQLEPVGSTDLSLYYRPGKIRFSASRNQIEFPKSLLDRKFEFPAAKLQSLIDRRIDSIERSYTASLVERCKEIITRTLARGDCNIEFLANNFDMHSRVLQRRLKAENTSYSQLLQEVRLQIARQHLMLGLESITELALSLGYSELAVFSRHFKKWTGMSPKQWRQTHRSNTALNTMSGTPR